jgi:hypothetical protein
MNIEISPKEYEKFLNWHDATLYCQLLTIDGKDNWRLPTRYELMHILYNSFCDDGPFWSSCEYDDECSWTINMMYGIRDHSHKSIRRGVMPVRTIDESL